MPDKITLRKQILEKRASLPQYILDMTRKVAADKLTTMEEYKNANVIMAYMDFRNEVPTGAIIEMIRSSGKRLILPFTDKSFNIIPYEIPGTGELTGYLATSSYGIAEPNPKVCREGNPETIDLIIIPGAAFDQYENRIGYGKGCYDRFLSSMPHRAFKLALAYDFQVLPCVPAGPADVKMDKILTLNTTNVSS